MEIVELLEGNSPRNPSIPMLNCCAALQSCSLSAARFQKAAGTILDWQLQIIIHIWEAEDVERSVVFYLSRGMSHGRSHRAPPQLCFSTRGSSKTVGQEVSL